MLLRNTLLNFIPTTFLKIVKCDCTNFQWAVHSPRIKADILNILKHRGGVGFTDSVLYHKGHSSCMSPRLVQTHRAKELGSTQTGYVTPTPSDTPMLTLILLLYTQKPGTALKTISKIEMGSMFEVFICSPNKRGPRREVCLTPSSP